MINFKSIQELISTVICDKADVSTDCYLRKCCRCREKRILFEAIPEEEDAEITYQKWATVRKEIEKNKQKKTVTKNVKMAVKCKKSDLTATFSKELIIFLTHLGNIRHQYQEIDALKKNLKENEILIHCDFSENWSCKLSTEIQALHFGLRPQVSIHTVVIYYKKKEELEKKCFSTISSETNHGPPAIVSHLKPVLNYVKENLPHVNTIHFLSDGPSTQYRSKNFFFVIVNNLPNIFKPEHVNLISWNYSESGHGKGAVDGLGGCLKRTADDLVAKGNDIFSCSEFYSKVGSAVKGIVLYEIKSEEFDKIVYPENLKTFAGTQKVHQVIWSKENKTKLYFRQLSCFYCRPATKCRYYLGEQDYSTDTSPSPNPILHKRKCPSAAENPSLKKRGRPKAGEKRNITETPLPKKKRGRPKKV